MAEGIRTPTVRVDAPELINTTWIAPARVLVAHISRPFDGADVLSSFEPGGATPANVRRP
jgi:hypothetical protein